MLFSVFYFFLLEFFSIFQNFQYFSVFLGIFQYFSVFFSIFGTFQYFSCFSVFSVFFVIFSIRQIKRISCHFQQPVMMLRKTFSKKRRRLLHSQIITWVSHSLFLIFQISETRSIKCPSPVNFTASLCYMSCPLGKLCTCQNKSKKRTMMQFKQILWNVWNRSPLDPSKLNAGFAQKVWNSAFWPQWRQSKTFPFPWLWCMGGFALKTAQCTLFDV